jgi:dihydrofolate reductase
MRRVIFGGANSLDNFMARSDGSVDWLKWNSEVAAISKAFWNTVDAVVIGRKTYDPESGMGTVSFPGIKNYLVSRTLKESGRDNVQLVSGDAVEFVRRLKSEPGKGICIMSGGNLARSLLESDLIDEIGVNIHPVLLGEGVPLFYEMSRQIDLELLECKQLANGCVVLRYGVKHQKRSRKA